MQKTICVINGKGGVGKDTLIDSLINDSDTIVYNISSIDPIRELCAELTKGCEKDLAQRKLLAGVKELADSYYKEEHGISYTQNYLQQNVRFALADANNYNYAKAVIFIHIREPYNIEEFVNRAKDTLIKDNDTTVVTLLVESNRAMEHYGNEADDLVNEYDYDYTYISKGNIEDDAKSFRKFFSEIVVKKEKTDMERD